MATSMLIDPGFFDAVARLTPTEQARAVSFINTFRASAAHPSIQLHAIDAARSRGMWSGRITRDLRAILHKDGDTWVLLHVDHHNPAYAWAERRDIGRHPVTGALQIIESVETIHQPLVTPTAAAVPRLFAKHDDAYLLSLGVPQNWLPTLRQIATEDDLLVVCQKLPAEVSERLLDLAAGEIVTPPAPVAPERPLIESADTRRRFYVADDADELRAALAAPLDRWIAFLHPSQRAIVSATSKGPVKVSGSAGTGKTVVAMHRARHLARKGVRVLFTSYVSTLCENLARGLRKLCSAEEMERITVSTVHKQALDLVHEVEPRLRLAGDDEIRALLESLTTRRAPSFDAAFVRAEWENVVLAQGVASWAEYRTAKRTGRGRPLSVADRKVLWEVFEGVQIGLANRSLADWQGLCRTAEKLLVDKRVASPYQAVIVDELQDLKPAELRFLRALCADNPENLMLAGDAAQRIYAGGFSLGGLGIDVRGRAHVLRINYRTTEQIRRVADQLLRADVDDLDGGAEPRKGTRSLLRGPAPSFEAFPTGAAEIAAAVAWVQAKMTAGLRPDELACFARAGKRLDEVRGALAAAKVPFQMLSDKGGAGAGVHLGTMHRAKGLEFKAVLVVDCSADSLPSPTALKGLADPLDRELAEERERQLLYVAMTRARDELRVTWSEAPSPLLAVVGA